MRDAGIKQLVNQYFDALDTGNIEEYLNLFSPSDRAQMEPILRKIGNLEMADWAGLKKKYGWLFTEKDRRLDMEICSVEAGTPTGDQVRSFEPEAKVWKITFCYYNGSQMREHRSHILVRKKEGFFLYLPLDMEARGGTVALNVYDSHGRPVDHQIVEERANEWGISLRTGCFCNPGAGEMALGLERGEILTCLHQSGDRMTLNEFRQCIDGKSTGAVRISFGIGSNFPDALTVSRFFRDFLNG